MTWPIDKLALCNQMLAITGNNLVPVADDGYDEWVVCSAAYEYAIEYMLDSHEWKQLTNVVVLNPTGSFPSDPEFDTAYAKPADCIHIIWVRQYMPGTVSVINPNNATVNTQTLNSGKAIDYQVLNNQIIVNNYGGVASAVQNQVTNPVSCLLKYVSSSPPGLIVNGVAQSSSAQAQMLRTFMTALGRFVMAGIYRGLHEDIANGRAEEQAARELLQEAKTRSDQEQPKRAMFNSRLSSTRQVRRLWPNTPRSWGGTGAPG